MTTYTETRHYWRGLDLLKFILAFFIVAAHCRLGEEQTVIKQVLDILFSIAVPLFFAISAFVFVKRMDYLDKNEKTGVLKHYFLRLAILFGVWYILAFPVNYNLWWKVSTPKETLFAIFFGCTAWGYWFIKALGINLLLLYLCRRKGSFSFLCLMALVIYFVFSFNYVFEIFHFPYHPYYSFYYHSAYCCTGACLARNPESLSKLENNHIALAAGWLLMFAAAWFEPIRPAFKLLSIVLVLPCFSRLSDGRDLKHLRYISTIIYMSQFIVIYYYSLLSENATSFFFSLSPVRFFVVVSLCLVFAYSCVAFSKRFPVLKYLM